MDYDFTYTLTRKKVKYANIKISADKKISISVPLRYSNKDIKSLLEKKSGWILKTLKKFDESKRHINLNANEYLLFGKVYIRKENPSLKDRVVVNFDNATIETGLNLDNKSIQAGWYKSMANSYFPQRVAELAKMHNLNFAKISIRGQKTRWGSCSFKKNLAFNWKLMKAPHFIIDYIIIHELSHTKFLNHSRSFWNMVESLCPEYKQSEAWLKKYGNGL